MSLDFQTMKITKSNAETNSRNAKHGDLQESVNFESAENKRLRSSVEYLEMLSKNHITRLKKQLFQFFNFLRRAPNENIFLIHAVISGQLNVRMFYAWFDGWFSSPYNIP
jgi:hypothetical protein